MIVRLLTTLAILGTLPLWFIGIFLFFSFHAYDGPGDYYGPTNLWLQGMIGASYPIIFILMMVGLVLNLPYWIITGKSFV